MAAVRWAWGQLRLELSPLLGLRRTLTLHHVLDTVLHLSGDVAECGVGDGRTAAGLVWHLGRWAPQKTVHLFDTFTGLPMGENTQGRYAHSVHEVTGRLAGLNQWQIHKGPFTETLYQQPMCLIHADADLYSSTCEIIAWAKNVLVPGGAVVFDDYHNPEYPGVTKAVDELLGPPTDGTELTDGIQLVYHAPGVLAEPEDGN